MDKNRFISHYAAIVYSLIYSSSVGYFGLLGGTTTSPFAVHMTTLSVQERGAIRCVTE